MAYKEDTRIGCGVEIEKLSFVSMTRKKTAYPSTIVTDNKPDPTQTQAS